MNRMGKTCNLKLSAVHFEIGGRSPPKEIVEKNDNIRTPKGAGLILKWTLN